MSNKRAPAVSSSYTYRVDAVVGGFQVVHANKGRRPFGYTVFPTWDAAIGAIKTSEAIHLEAERLWYSGAPAADIAVVLRYKNRDSVYRWSRARALRPRPPLPSGPKVGYKKPYGTRSQKRNAADAIPLTFRCQDCGGSYEAPVTATTPCPHCGAVRTVV